MGKLLTFPLTRVLNGKFAAAELNEQIAEAEAVLAGLSSAVEMLVADLEAQLGLVEGLIDHAPSDSARRQLLGQHLSLCKALAVALELKP